MKLPITSITVKTGRRAIDDAKVRELASSMDEVGLINPVTVTPSHVLVAGAHRLEAAKALGWTEVEANVLDGNDLMTELAEIDENLMRNELHYLDSGNLQVRRVAILKKLNLMAKPYRPEKGDKLAPLSTIADLAAQSGVSERTFQRRKQIAENLKPEVQEAVKAADLPQKDAEKIARLEPEEQLRVAHELNEGATSLLDARRRIKRNDVHGTPELTGKYRVIYADPPWAYTTQLSEGYGSVQNHYPTMTEDELMALPVGDIADENSILYLWATSIYLPVGLALIKAWGFNYKGAFIWDKVKHNMGNYNSVRHEFLLFGTKGSCLPEKGKLYDSVVSEERTEHSVKPETFRKIIEDLYPSGKKVELFSRAAADGWTAWGNQA